MATFIPAPGVAQTVITQHIAGHKANNVLHWYHGSSSPWTVSDMQTLCNTLFTQWTNVWKNQMASNIAYQNVAGVDLTNTTPVSATSTGTAVTAVGTGVSNPGLSLMVSFNIGSRYRGGHPRCYLPPFQSTAMTTNEDQWIPSALTAAVNGFVTMVSAVVAALPGVTHCVPRWTYLTSVSSDGKKIIRTKNGYLNQFTVSSYTALAPVRSQRRRTTAGS